MATLRKISTISLDTFYPLAKVKEFLRITHNHQDALLRSISASALTTCEKYARVGIIQQVWRVAVQRAHFAPFSQYTRGQFLTDEDDTKHGYTLPKKFVTSIASVTASGTAVSNVVLNPSLYSFNDVTNRLTWQEGYADATSGCDTLVIQFTIGFATYDQVAALYPDLWQAVGLTLNEAYRVGEDTNFAIPVGAKEILNQYWTPVP